MACNFIYLSNYHTFNNLPKANKILLLNTFLRVIIIWHLLYCICSSHFFLVGREKKRKDNNIVLHKVTDCDSSFLDSVFHSPFSYFCIPSLFSLPFCIILSVLYSLLFRFIKKNILLTLIWMNIPPHRSYLSTPQQFHIDLQKRLYYRETNIAAFV